MTIDEVEDTLPNGFHDAELHSIQIDYGAKIAKFVITADMTAPDEAVEVNDRKVELIVSGLIFISIDAPDPSYPYTEKSYRIGGFFSSGKEIEALKVQGINAALPPGAFYNVAFVNDWNSFIHVTGMNAELKDL
ncbi:MAG: hypothetical protein JWO13_2167 [Acidobacteriales bacterium]|nr:hypothetical protein [Terriglobales bacterium]